MSKLRLLAMVVLMVAFLLSLWGVPVVMAVIAVTVIETLWIKIALWVAAALWLLLLVPGPCSAIPVSDNSSRICAEPSTL